MRNRLAVQLERLSPHSHALVATLAKSRHLERREYTNLRRSPIGPSVTELRVKGFLVRLSGANKTRVYWFPPRMAGDIREALQLVAPVSPEVQQTVNHELRGV